MRASRFIAFVTLALGLWPSLVSAQALERTCLPGDSRSQALDAVVDAAGTVHLSRVDRVSGDLLHTRIAPDGRAVDTVVAAGISRLAVDEVTRTGLALWHDEPAICFHSARIPGLGVATHDAAGWHVRTLVTGADAGRDCALVADATRLRVIHRDADTLVAGEIAPGAWAPITLDRVPGRTVGRDLAALSDATGHLLVAHHDGLGQLRVTWETPAGFQTLVGNPGGVAAGVRPTLTLAEDGTLVVLHGGLDAQLDSGSDVGLYDSRGGLEVPFVTHRLSVDTLGGGQAVLSTASGRALFARDRQRSALFGAYDALWWMSESAGGFVGDVLEQATSASARHDYGPIRGAVDPFGQPVLVYGDARAASIFGPATAPTCLYRLADTDADAIPDAVEPTLGTDPARADTDGDGQPDGQEVLLLGTDPTIPDGCTPSPEVCDALDNDCDGEVDEALEQACYPGPANTRGVGLCHAGTQLCGAGAWGACQGAVTPAASDATCDARDEDCDGAVDDNYVRRVTRCGVGACAALGMTACVAGRVQDSCAPGAPAVDDATCNGVDDDCNGAVDEEATPTPVRCGAGACAAEGEVVCTAGALIDTCRPGVGAADDTTCDGLDDDCDGSTDEDFRATATECGAGACTAVGTTRCVAGAVVDTCRAAAAHPDDATCDAIDDDCDGALDEDFAAQATTCGRGVCAAAGQRTCAAGRVTDDCRPGAPSGDDTACDGLDDDCDGVADDGFVPVPTTCGEGLCRAAGEIACVDGRRVEACSPLPAADITDTRCDGQDEDCDGAVDDDVRPGESRCGLGVCERTAETLCADGATVDPCMPGPPTGADADCNGLDDDCDGAADDGFVPERTTCGQGACAREVVVRCEAGARVGVCRPGEPAADDATCDGVDDDCDGRVDEDFAPTPETCGVGACASVGQLVCVGGATASTCVPDPPAARDATCDAVDDDCNGQTDEDFLAAPTACGVGACADTGVEACREGRVVDTCAPGAAAPSDPTCDAVDDDCDGATDEDFVPTVTRCGAGVCAATGQSTCVAGRRVEDCRATPPSVPRDRSCNGLDDDCDGQTDEDYRGAFTACGVGDCAARGLMVCRNGAESNLCTPGRPAAADATCDGRDNDCDGATDEDFVPAPTTCGVGPCGATGHSACVGGRLADDCAPGAPLGDDTTCDAVDDDCDGVADDAFVGAVVGCGAGACAAEAREQCVGGEIVSACAPGGGAADDTTCDGVDDDCDGETDEDFVAIDITCGQGACAATGQRTCAGGAPVDNCRPAAPTGDDSDCDGADDDCDGQADDAFLGAPLSCGEGACRAEGREVCVGGQVVADCTAGAPGGDDADCDGFDDDCDGETDEAFVPAASTCGVGACARAGLRVCDHGAIVDDCAAGAPAADDASCDGADDDCDGDTDEDFAPAPVACAPGACAAEGVRRCVAGVVVDTCDRPSAATDTTCDGVDDDCNGRVDDGFVGEAIECGVGVCVRAGRTRCVAARLEPACVPGAPAPADARCDGLDDDCDGAVDDDVSPTPTRCGVGACAAAGSLRCDAGAAVDTCVPRAPRSADDATCDGIDDDCDGEADEDFVGAEVTCGVGACTTLGETRCVAGRVVESCRAPAPASPVDTTCDGVDDDCDGRADDDFVGAATHCGVGACRAVGRERCVAGVRTEACQPGAPAASDALCNGLDDDCDGQIDEDFAPTPSRCGVGACEARGETRCAAGRQVDTCVAGPAAPRDATCDRVDDDCDGRVDDDVAPVAATCGEGLCAAEGQRVCELGRLVERCRPLAPAAADDDCDGRDQDCDGTADDDFVPGTILCGEGACGAMGTRDCVAGRSVDNCRPGAPAADDHTCDALDDDCDGEDDEDAPRAPSRCGVGACAATGEVRCVAGAFVDTCSPGAPAPDDTTCDDRDDDCDGVVDEDCAPVKADAAYPPAPDAAVPPPTPDAAVAPADAGTDAEETADAGAPTGDASTALDAFAVTTVPDMEAPPEPESDAYLIPVPDMLTLEVDATPPPVVSCDCRASGGAGDRAAWGLLLLLLGGLRRRVSARRGSSPRA
jgi:hypothetical protein